MSDSGMNDPINNDGEQQAAGPAARLPGAQLAAYREERGWSIDQVASQLNLAPRQVVAIESDNYAALPGMAIVRGFIRAYAKLLKVDAAPLLATIPGEPLVPNGSAELRRTLATPFSETSLPSMTRRGISGKHVAGVVLLILLVAGVWAAQQMGDFTRAFSSSVERDLANLSGLRPESAQPAPMPAEPEPNPATAPDNNATGNAAIGAAAPMPEQVAPAVAMPDAKAADSAAAGQDALVLRAREDAWVEITRPDNSIVFSRLLRAGATERIEVKGPLSLVIGNAAGVDATLRGNPVEMKTSTRSNVARLSLK